MSNFIHVLNLLVEVDAFCKECVEIVNEDIEIPYSALKSSSDHFVRAFHDTYGMPTIVTNCSNNYGPYQFPEKLIPLFINNISHRKPLPVYGKGENVRDWLYVEDHARAIDMIFHKGKIAETYNIGGFNEWKNIDIIKVVIKMVDRLLGRPEGADLDLITYVTDRKGHDMRYAIDSRKDGLRCCILKGQGNALMYPNPYSRTPGDVDVWVDSSRATVIEYAKWHFELGDDIRYHHLETSMDGVPVELHFFPCVMNNPIYNRRLQKWFQRNADLQCSNIVSLPDDAGEIAVPTTAFNVIYQLCHLYHHFFDEGIGFRQIIDYYLVIDKWHTDLTEFTDRELNSRNLYAEYADRKAKSVESVRSVCEKELKHLGLWKFAGAVMYVQHEVLGLPEEKMICPMDVKRGKLLLSEIMDGGNFGKHYFKYDHFTQQGMAKKYFLKIWRNMHFVRYYPAEALSEPIFRTWHFFWRMKNNK